MRAPRGFSGVAPPRGARPPSRWFVMCHGGGVRRSRAGHCCRRCGGAVRGRAGIWLGRSRGASARGRAGPERPWPCYAAISPGCAWPACQRCAAGRPRAEYACPQTWCARPRANHVCTHAPLCRTGARREPSQAVAGRACMPDAAGRVQAAPAISPPSATALRRRGARQLLCQNAGFDRAAGDKPSHGRRASSSNCTRMRGCRFGVHAHPGTSSEEFRVFANPDGRRAGSGPTGRAGGRACITTVLQRRQPDGASRTAVGMTAAGRPQARRRPPAARADGPRQRPSKIRFTPQPDGRRRRRRRRPCRVAGPTCTRRQIARPNTAAERMDRRGRRRPVRTRAAAGGMARCADGGRRARGRAAAKAVKNSLRPASRRRRAPSVQEPEQAAVGAAGGGRRD